MAEIKEMYKKVVKDKFPETIKIDMGGQVLEYRKKVWNIYDADEKADVERGIRYGENPDQPAALYELVNGNIVLGDVRFFDFDGGLVSKITEKDQLQVGKHPGKINLTDVDNALNITPVPRPETRMRHHEAQQPVRRRLRIDLGARLSIRPSGATGLRPSAAQWFSQNPRSWKRPRPWRHTTSRWSARPIMKGRPSISSRSGRTSGSFRSRRSRTLQKYKTKSIIDFKSLMDGGLIIQESQPFTIKGAERSQARRDQYKGEAYKIKQAPTEKELEDMLFGWYVESGVSSNSALFVKDEATVAIGTGEQDRVGVVEIATFKAYTKYLDGLVFKKFGVPYAVSGWRPRRARETWKT